MLWLSKSKPMWDTYKFPALGKSFRRSAKYYKDHKWCDNCVLYKIQPRFSKGIRLKGKLMIPRTYRDMPQRWWDAKFEREDKYTRLRFYRGI